MKGTIIAIEGTDGAGKNTQQKLLAQALEKMGYGVFKQSFPNYESPSSAPVKMYLGGEFGENANCLNAYQASALYAIDRLCTYTKTIKPHYENGEIIMFDRYVLSNFIHQCSKIDDINEKMEFINWAEDLEYNRLGLPKPDLIFFIEMPVEKSIELAHARPDYKTGGSKDIHEQDASYLKKSYENGLGLAETFGWTIIHCVDKNGNLRTIEDIHGEIMCKTLEYLTINNIKPIA